MSLRRRTKDMKSGPPILTEEEQQLRDQCNLLLKDFDKTTKRLELEAEREMKMAQDSIDKIYKIEVMKMTKKTKNMLWSDYFQQNGGSVLGVSEAIATVLDYSVLEGVEAQVSNIKSMKTAGRKNMSKRKPSGSRCQPSDDSNGTVSVSSGSFANCSAITPMSSQMFIAGSTPMITPKFDTSSLSRTVTRIAKEGEVLVSLAGSPVVPLVAGGAKGLRKGAKAGINRALIPLGGGNTLNVPFMEDPQGIEMPMELDSEQLGKIQELHNSLGNMLKMKAEAHSIELSSNI